MLSDELKTGPHCLVLQSHACNLGQHTARARRGAGPAGLTSALMLALNGIPLRIIDREEKFHIGSRGFGIQPRTLELFRLLGIADAVDKRRTPIPTMRFYKLPGGVDVVKEQDLYPKQDPGPDKPYGGNGACLSQADSEDIMRERLKELGVRVELGKELVGLKQGDDTVTATVGEEVIVTRYIVGADGAKGATRDLLGMTFERETYGKDGMVWADVEIQGLDTDFWHVWDKASFTIMARPLSPEGNAFGLGIMAKKDKKFDIASIWDENVSREESVVKFFHKETDRTDLRFGAFTWLSDFRLSIRVVNKLSEGNCFVVGDAAHVHPPTGGQGMNSSIQDACNVAWKLALAVKGLANTSLLDSYNSERLPVIQQMIEAARNLYENADSKLKQAIEPGENAPKSHWLRWRHNPLLMYGVNYRFSDIVLDSRTADTKEDAVLRAYEGYAGPDDALVFCAGDRAPDAPGLVHVSDGRETSLFSLFTPNKHTILVFLSSTDLTGHEVEVQQIAEVSAAYAEHLQIYFIVGTDVENAGGDNTTYIADRGGHARRSYCAVEGQVTVVAIRPDMFVGAIARAMVAAALDRYLKGIFSVQS